jgi:hypothetical protein
MIQTLTTNASFALLPQTVETALQISIATKMITTARRWANGTSAISTAISSFRIQILVIVSYPIRYDRNTYHHVSSSSMATLILYQSPYNTPKRVASMETPKTAFTIPSYALRASTTGKTSTCKGSSTNQRETPATCARRQRTPRAAESRTHAAFPRLAPLPLASASSSPSIPHPASLPDGAPCT